MNVHARPLPLLCGLGIALGAAGSAAQELTIAMPATEIGATSYDPVTATKISSAITLIYDRLVERDADQSFHPHLAASWEESEDGLEWTFDLAGSVTFHDGTPFDAQTVADWIPNYEGTENAFLTEAIERVEVVDAATVKFHMSRPEPNLLYNLASGFMSAPSQTAVAEMGDDYGVAGAVGSGPFEMESFEIGLQTMLTRNEDYA